MQNRILIFLTMFLILLLISCPVKNVTGDDGGSDGSNGGNSDYTNIPVSTIEWEADGLGFIRYYTNDINKIIGYPSGRTFWHPFEYAGSGDVYDVDLTKISGKAAYGYGLIFCIQDDVPAMGDFTATDFYALLIRVDGYYQVIKVVDSQQYRLAIDGCDANFWAVKKDIDGNNVLLAGKNVLNNIRIETTEDAGDGNDQPEFKIYFNNILAYEFEDNYTNEGTLPLFTYDAGKDKYGYMVVLGPNEDFPVEGVDVRFKHN